MHFFLAIFWEKHKHRGNKSACFDPVEDKHLPLLISTLAISSCFADSSILSSWVKCPLLPLSHESEREKKKVKAIYMWHIEFDRFVIASGAKPAALISTFLTHTHTHAHVNVHASLEWNTQKTCRNVHRLHTQAKQLQFAWECKSNGLDLVWFQIGGFF